MTMLNLAGYQETDLLYSGTRTLVCRAIRTTDTTGVVQCERQSFVVKVLRNACPNFNELVQFRNQYAIARHLQHPAIVQPLALERYGRGYALIMPDEGAIALAGYWKQSSRSFNEFLAIAIQLAEALHYLSQQRIVHKDIKPSNILIHPQTQRVQLIDFSISSLLPKEQQQPINPNVLEGTLAYISPEQTGRTNRGIDYRADFYSLGVTFFELLTGELPFATRDLMELVHHHIAREPSFPASNDRRAVPETLQAIVLKLMAKNAEDRYQSALGLKHDLERCLHQLDAKGALETFKLGERDACDRFLIPEKLYGRETEVETLLAAFERVANPPQSPLSEGERQGSEMMLVAGFSGIGKTAVINEVHKPIVRRRGYFIKGKFDQFNRNIPFSAFVRAFRDLMGQLFGESDTQLEQWKSKILAALGDSGQVMIDVIPELEAIIGPQPAVAELSGSAAQNRFNLLLGKFVRVFTTKEHPLVLFLDDLQWADSASLNLIKVLMDNRETEYLLLLGAYRDNEVFPAHLLMLTLSELEKEQAIISTITLNPLALSHINQWVAETLSCDEERSQPLTELVYQKTQGNPFFTTQFLKGLHEDALIAFNFNVGYWECDLVRVRDAALTDDVVEFMAGRLQRLPEATQNVLKLAACIGNQFELETLAMVCEDSEEEVAADIWSALQEGLVLPASENYKFFQGDTHEAKGIEEVSVGYRFLHDRVQQAAYTLIPESQKQKTHYHIGQLLLQQIPPEAREDSIFVLVHQLNYGAALITTQKERDELAQLNLIACCKARSATAYEAGREYAETGLSLLTKTAWQHQYEISLTFYDLMAELAFLCGDLKSMERFIEVVVTQSRSLLDRVRVRRLQIQAYASQNKLIQAVTIALQFLEKLGIAFPESPTEEDVRQGIAEVRQRMGDRHIEDFVNLPQMTDARYNAIVQIANGIMPAVFISRPSLFPLLVCATIQLSIEYGNAPASAYSYSCYGLIACKLLQDVDTGVRFGRLGLQVVSKLNAKVIQPEVATAVGSCILHRKFHMRTMLPVLREGYETALEIGNLEFAGYTAYLFCLVSFWCNQLLPTLRQETSIYCNALLQFNQLTSANYCQLYWQSTLNLMGESEHPTHLSGEAFQETEFLHQMLEANDFNGLYFFYLFKLMLCYLFEDIESARNHTTAIKPYFEVGTGSVGEPAFYFYDSLIALASLDSSSSEKTAGCFERVDRNQTKMQQHWASHAPMNYQHKVDLVEAEKCRILGEKLEAIELYDRAIAGAKENEYIQEEALANELAAKFYLDWGKENYAKLHMQEAYYCYARWGARAKVEDVEKRYPTLLDPILQRQKNTFVSNANLATLTQGTIAKTTSGTGEILDLATLMKASRTLSENIELAGAIANLMQVAKENAGAETVALMLFQEQVLMLTAKVSGEDAPRLEPIPVETSNAVPLSIVNKVKRSQELLVLENASRESTFAGDAYIQQHQPQSILCLPLLDRGRLRGILYLENNRVVGAFTSDRLIVLDFLCTQAAISLENARLYQKAQDYARELERSQLQLVQREKMALLGNLVAGVGHEINNPLGFLSGSVEYANAHFQALSARLQLYQQQCAKCECDISDRAEDEDIAFVLEDFPDLLGTMKHGIARLEEISKSLRIFSRTDERIQIGVNIHEGLESTLLILKYRLKANENRPEIQIIREYGDLLEISCFLGQLNQVFTNILANAIDMFDEISEQKSRDEIAENPPKITIRTVPVGDRIRIEIQDNGTGMDEEVRSRIFDASFTTKAVGKGTGLGLAIAHQIITEKHGGKIECKSELGKGTTFAIVLPISE